MRNSKVPSLEQLAKAVPQVVELEASTLGAILLEKSAQIALIEKLNPDDFYNESHKVVFEAILDLHTQNRKIDFRTVTVQLMKNGKLDLVGGPTFTAELTSKTIGAHHAEDHAVEIIENSLRRKLILIGGELMSEAYEPTYDVFELLDAIQKKLDSVTGNKLTEGFKKSGRIVQDAFARIREIHARKGISGVPSLPSIDRITGGWQSGLFIVIAARPGMGKSAFLGMCCESAAISHNIPVAVFSLEMSAVQLMNRMISSQTGIELGRIVHGQITEPELVELDAKLEQLKAAPIHIDDSTAVHYLTLRSKVRKMIAEHNVGIILIDYLQLMKGDNKGNREREISSITEALKNLAKEINRPIIALSQLSRDVEKRGGDKRPQLSDLRESGSIEQDANIVAFLYRPEYYKIKNYENGKSTEGVLEVIFAKHRDGALEKAELKFTGKITKVSEFPEVVKQANIFGDTVPF